MQAPGYDRIVIDNNLLRALLGMSLFLFLANLLLIPFSEELEATEGHFQYVLEQVDLNSEGTFATWFSSMLLLLNSLSAYLLARARWATNQRAALSTAIMAAGFLFLSIDDFIGFHESLESVTANLFIHNDSVNNAALKRNMGPLFGLSLAIILAIMVVGPYLRAVQPKNIPLLIGSIGCVFAVGVSELVYNVSGCTELWCFRIEVLFEEVSELGALLLFLTFQSRELSGLGGQAVPV